MYIKHISYFDFYQPAHCIYFFLHYQMGALLYVINFNIVYGILIVTLMLAILLLLVINIKFNQMDEYAKKSLMLSSTFSGHKFALFAYHNNLSLKLLRDGNLTFGKSIFAYMIVNMPLSSLLLMMLLLGKLNSKKVVVKALIIFFVSAEFGSIVIISLICAILSQKLHRPVKRFFRLIFKPAQSSQKVALTIQMRVAAYIEFFHTENRFALSYGRMGKITFGSCGKVRLTSDKKSFRI